MDSEFYQKRQGCRMFDIVGNLQLECNISAPGENLCRIEWSGTAVLEEKKQKPWRLDS